MWLIWFLISFLLICELAVLTLKPEIVIAQDISHVEKTKMLSKEITRLSAKYNVDENLAIQIIKCESNFNPGAINKNIDSSGKVWSVDRSYWQINDYFHTDAMEALGLDIDNQWDNLEYGFIILSKQGTKPWSASKSCWSQVAK